MQRVAGPAAKFCAGSSTKGLSLASACQIAPPGSETETRYRGCKGIKLRKGRGPQARRQSRRHGRRPCARLRRAACGPHPPLLGPLQIPIYFQFSPRSRPAAPPRTAALKRPYSTIFYRKKPLICKLFVKKSEILTFQLQKRVDFAVLVKGVVSICSKYQII